jgi:hypothetical protein
MQSLWRSVMATLMHCAAFCISRMGIALSFNQLLSIYGATFYDHVSEQASA